MVASVSFLPNGVCGRETETEISNCLPLLNDFRE